MMPAIKNAQARWMLVLSRLRNPPPQREQVAVLRSCTRPHRWQATNPASRAVISGIAVPELAKLKTYKLIGL